MQMHSDEEIINLNYAAGYDYGLGVIADAAFGTVDLAREYRGATDDAEDCTWVEFAAFHQGTAAAFGRALAASVDTDATTLTPLDVTRLSAIKERIDRGDLDA